MGQICHGSDLQSENVRRLVDELVGSELRDLIGRDKGHPERTIEGSDSTLAVEFPAQDIPVRICHVNDIYPVVTGIVAMFGPPCTF